MKPFKISDAFSTGLQLAYDAGFGAEGESAVKVNNVISGGDKNLIRGAPKPSNPTPLLTYNIVLPSWYHPISYFLPNLELVRIAPYSGNRTCPP